jgi:hypothetical protein
MDANSLNGSGVNPNPAGSGYWSEHPMFPEIALNASTSPLRRWIFLPLQPSQQTAQEADLQGKASQPNLQRSSDEAGKIIRWEIAGHQFLAQQKQIPTQKINFHPQQNLVPGLQSQNQQLQQKQPAQLGLNQLQPQQNTMTQQPVQNQNQQLQQKKSAQLGPNHFHPQLHFLPQQPMWQQQAVHQQQRFQYLHLQQFSNGANGFQKEQTGVQDHVVLEQLKSEQEKQTIKKQKLVLKGLMALKGTNANIPADKKRTDPFGPTADVRKKRPRQTSKVNNRKDMAQLTEKFKGIMAQFAEESASIDDEQFFELEKISLALLAYFNAAPSIELKSELSLAFHILAKHCIGNMGESAIKKALIDKAINYYASAEKFAPPEKVEVILSEVSLFCRTKNRYAQEIEQLKKLAQYENGWRAYNRIGCIYFEKYELSNDSYNEAVKYLKLGSQEGDLTAFYNLAQLYDIISFKSENVKSKIKYKEVAIALYKNIAESTKNHFSGKAIFSEVFLSAIDSNCHFTQSELMIKRKKLQDAEKEVVLDARIPLTLALVNAILYNENAYALSFGRININLLKAYNLGSQIASTLLAFKTSEELISALIAYIKKPYEIYNENRDLTKLSD